MSFDDILEDIFDFDDEPKADPEDVTNEEKNSGLWDTGKKENVWRSSDPVANGVWDSGADKDDTADPAGSPCGGCADPCTDPDACGEEAEAMPEEVEPDSILEDSPDDEAETADQDSAPADSGLFDDLF